jgi:DUF4097 and DUF4098 domain-containing protein YvlB
MPTFTTAEPITAVLDLGVGDVRIIASDRADTTVLITPSDPGDASDVKAAEAARVEFADGELRIVGKKPGILSGRRKSDAINVVIELPTGSELRAEAQMADFRCDGRLGATRIVSGFGALRVEASGRLEVKSGLGRIDVGLVEGPAEIATGAGVVQVHAVDGALAVKNSNGSIRIGTVTGELRVKSANGDIAVDLAAGDAVLKNSNGAIRVREAAGGVLEADTALGDIEVGIREGLAAWLEVSSSTGRFFNELDESPAPAGDEASVKVRARTQVGDVVVRRTHRPDGD